MKRTYSVYEAKAKLSEIIRAVRERGETVTVSYHGEPAAEIRPVSREAPTTAERIAALESSGVIAPAADQDMKLPETIARKPGALKRFLEERDN